MKDRFRSLKNYHKIIIYTLVIMCLVFSILYALTLNEVGIFYGGEFFSQSNVGGSRYSAKIDDKEAYFTLEDKTVWFTVAEKTYGPYTTNKDITLHKEDIILKEGTNVVFEGDIIDSKCTAMPDITKRTFYS